jgi:NADPH-dependent ferric siderophore reductase
MGRDGGDAPWRFFDLRVIRTRRLGPTVVRVTFGIVDGSDSRSRSRNSGSGSGDTQRFTSGGRDQRVKLFFPHPHQAAPVVSINATQAGKTAEAGKADAIAEDWFAHWQSLPPDIRASMRTYTVREQRHAPQQIDMDLAEQIDVDFALHGDLGPASRWAGRARPGDRLIALGPTEADNRGIDFRPPQGTDWVLITGDETALPAIGGILRSLPADMPVRAWIEIAHPEDLQHLSTDAAAQINWLIRGTAARGPGLLLDMLRAADLPPGRPYAWLAGESGTVRALRRFLVGERGLDRRSVTFTGYWRQGASEEDLMAEALAGATR